MISVAGYFTFVITTGLLYICFYLYLDAMVRDLTMQMSEDNGKLHKTFGNDKISETADAALNFVRAIQFHNDIHG